MRDQEHQFREFVEMAVHPHLHHFSNLCRGAVVSTTEEDTRYSFDMRVGLWIPVSVRLRTSYYFRRFRDFSIRSKTRYSGQVINGEEVMCELGKLEAGYGNCYFYGWLSDDETEIEHYMLVDINRFRTHLHRGEDYPNGDGTYGRYYPRQLISMVGALVYQSWDDTDYPFDFQ